MTTKAAYLLADIAEGSLIYSDKRGPYGAPGAVILHQNEETREALRSLTSEEFGKLRAPDWLVVRRMP